MSEDDETTKDGIEENIDKAFKKLQNLLSSAMVLKITTTTCKTETRLIFSLVKTSVWALKRTITVKFQDYLYDRQQNKPTPKRLPNLKPTLLTTIFTSSFVQEETTLMLTSKWQCEDSHWYYQSNIHFHDISGQCRIPSSHCRYISIKWEKAQGQL